MVGGIAVLVEVLVAVDPAVDLEVDHEVVLAPPEGASPVVGGLPVEEAPWVEGAPVDDPWASSLGEDPSGARLGNSVVVLVAGAAVLAGNEGAWACPLERGAGHAGDRVVGVPEASA